MFANVLLELEVVVKDTPRCNLHHHFEHITRYLKRDGFIYEDGKIQAVGSSLPLEKLEDLAGSLDIPSLTRQIQRITDAVEEDPSLAIGTAKELTETTCKTILAERGLPYDHLDLVKLVGAVRKELKLTPDDIPDGTKADKSIKTILNNLGTIVQGLAELRNAYGTGHGKHGRAKGLQSRHARLAVGASGALATFLLETHLERSTTMATADSSSG